MNLNDNERLFMWFENGLIPELESLLIRNKINPESSEILKQAKEISKIFVKKNECKAFHTNNWGMMDGAEDGCGYDSEVECQDCIFGFGNKDPRCY